jgi:hypothetical protein
MIVSRELLDAATDAELDELADAVEAVLTRRALARRHDDSGGADAAVVDERPAPGGGTLRLEYVRCGKCGRCASGPVHGPYWYLYQRRAGKLVSKYIGKQLPASDGAQDHAPGADAGVTAPPRRSPAHASRPSH